MEGDANEPINVREAHERLLRKLEQVQREAARLLLQRRTEERQAQLEEHKQTIAELT